MKPFLLLAALLAAAACGAKKTGSALWDTYPGIAGHTWFPLAGTAHEPTPTGTLNAVTMCKDCHPLDSFKAMTDCKTCHFAQVPAPNDMGPHTGNPAYATALATGRTDYCLTCHPQGQAYSSLNHTKFPIGVGTKHNRSCALCHTTSGPATTDTTVTTSRSNAVQYGTLNCVLCHMDQLPPPNDTIFPPPTIDKRHLPASRLTGGIGYLLDYPISGIAPMDCMRCHDPTAMAPSAGAGNLVLLVANHGRRSGPPTVGSAGPWDGTHGNTGQSVHCWTCHDTIPPFFGGYSAAQDPSDPARPWAQNWSTNKATIPGYSCTIGSSATPAQHGCCTACHGIKN